MSIVQFFCITILFIYTFEPKNPIIALLLSVFITSIIQFIIWKWLDYHFGAINILLTIVVLIAAILRVYYGVYIFQHPARPSGIPQDAMWLGGSSGGMWMEFVCAMEDSVRLRVYFDCEPAILQCDSIFVFPDKNVNASNWFMYSPCFDGHKMIFGNSWQKRAKCCRNDSP